MERSRRVTRASFGAARLTQLKPTTHFYTRNKQPWVILPEDATTYETQPIPV